MGEDAATSVGPSFVPPALTEEERLELQEELVKVRQGSRVKGHVGVRTVNSNGASWLQVEDEIQTLSQVLAAKERRLADIKKKLGVTPLNELKQNISKTWQEVTASHAYVPCGADAKCARGKPPQDGGPISVVPLPVMSHILTNQQDFRQLVQIQQHT